MHHPQFNHTTASENAEGLLSSARAGNPEHESGRIINRGVGTRGNGPRRKLEFDFWRETISAHEGEQIGCASKYCRVRGLQVQHIKDGPKEGQSVSSSLGISGPSTNHLSSSSRRVPGTRARTPVVTGKLGASSDLSIGERLRIQPLGLCADDTVRRPPTHQFRPGTPGTLAANYPSGTT